MLLKGKRRRRHDAEAEAQGRPGLPAARQAQGKPAHSKLRTCHPCTILTAANTRISRAPDLAGFRAQNYIMKRNTKRMTASCCGRLAAAAAQLRRARPSPAPHSLAPSCCLVHQSLVPESEPCPLALASTPAPAHHLASQRRHPFRTRRPRHHAALHETKAVCGCAGRQHRRAAARGRRLLRLGPAAAVGCGARRWGTTPTASSCAATSHVHTPTAWSAEILCNGAARPCTRGWLHALLGGLRTYLAGEDQLSQWHAGSADLLPH